MKKYLLKNAQKAIPSRKNSDNKTHGGKALVIAGSKGMWGAAILTSQAAARSGAGYVYLQPLEKGFPWFKNLDFLMNKEKDFSKFNAIAIGPGANSSSLGKWVKNSLKNQRVVLDAAALNYLAKNKIKIPSTWILTPHEGELSRILKVSSETIRKDRVKYAKLAQKKLGCVVLLKGYRTLVVDSKDIFEIQSGNPALAKAGTGDVLTGVITGFLSQGLDATNAACLGAFVHGFIADQWVKKNDHLSLMASDLIQLLPEILRKIR